MDDFIIRKATKADILDMIEIIFEHGPNQWNHLPPAEVTAHLRKVDSGEVQATVAHKEQALVGFVSFNSTTDYEQYQPQARKEKPHAYIAEAVVHRDYGGKGLGSRLLKAAVDEIYNQGFSEIYVIRHEENAASACMMRKAGFEEVVTFYDPDHRPAGSQRTTICRKMH